MYGDGILGPLPNSDATSNLSIVSTLADWPCLVPLVFALGSLQIF